MLCFKSALPAKLGVNTLLELLEKGTQLFSKWPRTFIAIFSRFADEGYRNLYRRQVCGVAGVWLFGFQMPECGSAKPVMILGRGEICLSFLTFDSK